jgi:predicted enzyme related to lactoylglutathione lyase
MDDLRRRDMLGNAPMAATLVATDIRRAKKFYAETLGLQPANMPVPEDAAAFENGSGAMLYLYEREEGTKADHTAAAWMVEDLEETMTELREEGVVFEQYDMPGLKTDERGIAESDGNRSAWFKDTEGNILALVEM